MSIPLTSNMIVSIHYIDGSNVVDGSILEVKEFKIYGTVTESELENYILKPVAPVAP